MAAVAPQMWCSGCGHTQNSRIRPRNKARRRSGAAGSSSTCNGKVKIASTSPGDGSNSSPDGSRPSTGDRPFTPTLRKRFAGQPEHVVNFMFFVAEEARRIMARLGVRRFEDLVGRVDLLEADDAIERWKARGIDLSALLHAPDVPLGVAVRRVRPQVSPLDDALDWQLLEQARPALEDGTPVELDVPEPAPPLPAGLDLAAYRIVQEALTNVRRHAGQVPTEVRVRCGADGLALEVVNAPGAARDDASGAGRGLVGMQERVRMYGGQLRVGPEADGGWAVRAQLPVGSP